MKDTLFAIIKPKEAHISEKLSVLRVLPHREKRMVGPFCFLDHMGPHPVSADSSGDVLQHPHIGLSTLTYLFQGKLKHRDSLGTVQDISAGDVNWMTAGKGIVHSERIPPEFAAQEPTLHGLQAWVALPKNVERCEPFFAHHHRDEIPTQEKNNVKATLIAGQALGLKSPVPVSSSLFYIKLESKTGGHFQFQSSQQEVAFYLVKGSVKIEDQTFSEPILVVFKLNAQVEIEFSADSLGVLFGGDLMPEGRKMYWNFVATDDDLIATAKKMWSEQKFKMVEGENGFVPLPPEKMK